MLKINKTRRRFFKGKIFESKVSNSPLLKLINSLEYTKYQQKTLKKLYSKPKKIEWRLPVGEFYNIPKRVPIKIIDDKINILESGNYEISITAS